jgi:hypothetical protein
MQPDLEDPGPVEQLLRGLGDGEGVPGPPAGEDRCALRRDVGAALAVRHPELGGKGDEAREVVRAQRASRVAVQLLQLKPAVGVQDLDALLVLLESPERGLLRLRREVLAGREEDTLHPGKESPGPVLVLVPANENLVRQV